MRYVLLAALVFLGGCCEYSCDEPENQTFEFSFKDTAPAIILMDNCSFCDFE